MYSYDPLVLKCIGPQYSTVTSRYFQATKGRGRQLLTTHTYVQTLDGILCQIITQNTHSSNS